MRRGHTRQGRQRGPFDVLGQAARDLASQTSGTAVIVLSGVVFLAAAAVGQTLIGSLGDFGWIAYVTVLGVIAMALGPVFVVGVKVRLRGSARHRAEVEERVRQQRIKFGLVSPNAMQGPPLGADPAGAGAESQRRDTGKAST